MLRFWTCLDTTPTLFPRWPQPTHFYRFHHEWLKTIFERSPWLVQARQRSPVDKLEGKNVLLLVCRWRSSLRSPRLQSSRVVHSEMSTLTILEYFLRQKICINLASEEWQSQCHCSTSRGCLTWKFSGFCIPSENEKKRRRCIMMGCEQQTQKWKWCVVCDNLYRSLSSAETTWSCWNVWCLVSHHSSSLLAQGPALKLTAIDKRTTNKVVVPLRRHTSKSYCLAEKKTSQRPDKPTVEPTCSRASN